MNHLTCFIPLSLLFTVSIIALHYLLLQSQYLARGCEKDAAWSRASRSEKKNLRRATCSPQVWKEAAKKMHLVAGIPFGKEKPAARDLLTAGVERSCEKDAAWSRASHSEKKNLRRATCSPQVWLGWQESNLHGQSQSLLSYH